MVREFEDFGWERPDWYESNGPDREAAVAVEMSAVRTSIGIFDASPLGKIEVVGPGRTQLSQQLLRLAILRR